MASAYACNRRRAWRGIHHRSAGRQAVNQTAELMVSRRITLTRFSIGLAVLGAAGLAQASTLVSAQLCPLTSVLRSSSATAATGQAALGGAPALPPFRAVRSGNGCETVAGSSRLSGWLVATNANVDASAPTKGDLNIYIVQADGTGKKFLTNDFNVNAFPSWSSDGNKIVYAMTTPNSPAEIWIMDGDGGKKKQLTFPPSGGLMPSLSPDMKHILYVAPGPGENPEIWLMNADGSNQHRLTTTTTTAITRNGNRIRWSETPSFSSDGERIVYSSTQSGQSQIWVMNADGSGPRQLTFPDNPAGPDANAPSWSPDGKKIACWSGNETERGNIWLMNADGSGRQQLTFEGDIYNSDNPNWSPDGRHIIFESNHGDLAGVKTWIMRADGSDRRILLPRAYGIGRRPWKAD